MGVYIISGLHCNVFAKNGKRKKKNKIYIQVILCHGALRIFPSSKVSMKGCDKADRPKMGKRENDASPSCKLGFLSGSH